MKRLSFTWFWLVIVLVIALAGCSAGGAAPESGGGSTAPDAGGKGDAQGNIVITQDSVASGVEMKVGERAVVQLDPGFNWNVVASPDLVLSQVKDAPLEAGQQAVLEAKLPGNAMIQATGKPACAKDNPPCATPQAQMLIKIKVNPAD